MFEVDCNTVTRVLREYGIFGDGLGISELLRYHYEKVDSESKEVWLIVKAAFSNRPAVVIKFQNQLDYPQKAAEEQSVFSEHLRKRGVETARRYLSHGRYTSQQKICGVAVSVTVEDFISGEITYISEGNAFEIGAMQATAHQISEDDDCHVHFGTIFNPLKENDLFSYAELAALESKLSDRQHDLFSRIQKKYYSRMGVLESLKKRGMFAVQGDISANNLYRTRDGKIGMFDFNNCGDNYLLADAVMEGLLIAKLMDYKEPLTDELSLQLFRMFLKGYASVRPFTEEDRAIIPHLYAVATALWKMRLCYDEHCLKNLLADHNDDAVDLLLQEMLGQIQYEIPVRTWI